MLWTKGVAFAKDLKFENWNKLQAKELEDGGRPHGEIFPQKADPLFAATFQTLGFEGVGAFGVLGPSDGYCARWLGRRAENWDQPVDPRGGESPEKET